MALPVEKGAKLIVEDIVKEAKEKSAGIIRDAKKEARALIDAARLGVKEEEEQELKEARAKGKQAREEMLAEGGMRARREILRRREELINEILKGAENKLRTYASSKKYEADLVRIVVDACGKLGSNQAVIQANRRDLKLLEKNKGQVERELGGDKKGVGVSFGEPIQAIGGVRVKTPDGKVEIDETFDGRIKREFETLRVKVAKILFEGSK